MDGPGESPIAGGPNLIGQDESRDNEGRDDHDVRAELQQRKIGVVPFSFASDELSESREEASPDGKLRKEARPMGVEEEGRDLPSIGSHVHIGEAKDQRNDRDYKQHRTENQLGKEVVS